jgi:hypothetical protein
MEAFNSSSPSLSNAKTNTKTTMKRSPMHHHHCPIHHPHFTAKAPSANEVHHALLELLAERVQDGALVLHEQLHHALVAFGEFVAFEAIRVTALFLTHLAVPPQLLQAFGLNREIRSERREMRVSYLRAICNCLRSEKSIFTHGDKIVEISLVSRSGILLACVNLSQRLRTCDFASPLSTEELDPQIGFTGRDLHFRLIRVLETDCEHDQKRRPRS